MNDIRRRKPRDVHSGHLLLLCLLSIATGSASIPAASADEVEISGSVFGTTYRIRVRDDASMDRALIESRIHQRLSEIDERMSTYRDDSEVSRFNQFHADEWFEVSVETGQLVERALEISAQTDGAFDVTVGPLVALWNFGAQASGKFEPPSDVQIAETLTRVGYDKVEVRDDRQAIRKHQPGVELDLSAIAKGYAVDAVCEVLQDYPHFMVEIGGEVRTKGSRSVGDGWWIGVEAPTKGKFHVDRVVALSNEAMATSGDYRNFFEYNGVTYSHTIDPKSGHPVTHDLASATVIAADCATADALATALLVMGPDRGAGFAKQGDLKVLLASRKNGSLLANEHNFPTDVREPNGGFQAFRTFLIAAAVFGIAVLAMSLGTIIANKRLKGTCGGMAGLQDSGGKTICELCTKPSPECSGEPGV